MKLQIALSAIPLKKVKQLIRKNKNPHALKTYDAIFNKLGEGKKTDKYRLYIPLDEKVVRARKANPPQAIIDYLTSINYTINDYLLGTAVMPDGKRIVRLGKVLSRMPELSKMFENDPQRRTSKSENMWVVISRHPYDILGMSFDRGWTSCMNLDEGCNRHYLTGDLEWGTLVAYLVKNNDRNINNPTARIAIRPFMNTDGAIMLVPSETYGTDAPGFQSIVREFCKIVNDSAPNGRYTLNKALYDDGTGRDLYKMDAAGIAELPEEDAVEVACQPFLDSTVVEALLKRNSSRIGRYLIEKHFTAIPEQALIDIARNPDMERLHHSMLRSEKKLPVSVLLEFAKIDNADFKAALAGKTTHQEVLQALAESSDADVREAVARNTAAGKELIEKLADDVDENVRLGVMKNHNLSKQGAIDMLAKYPSARLITTLLHERSDIPLEITLPVVEQNLDYESLSELVLSLYNYAPIPMIEKIYALVQEKRQADEWNGDRVLLNLVRNEKTPRAIIYDIIQKFSYDDILMRAILRQADADSKTIELIFKMNPHNEEVAKLIIDREEPLEDEVVRGLLMSKIGNIVMRTMNRRRLTHAQIDYFVDNASEEMLKYVGEYALPAKHQYLLMTIAEKVKSREVLYAMANYNNNFSLPIIVTMLDNPTVKADPAILYCLYNHMTKDNYSSLIDMFKPYFAVMDQFAESEGRRTLREVDDFRRVHNR